MLPNRARRVRPPAGGPGRMTAATALVVDDEPAVRHLVRRILEPEICRVMEVEDGETALRLIERSRALSARVRQEGRRASGERLVSQALQTRTEEALAAAVDLVAVAKSLQAARAKAPGPG